MPSFASQLSARRLARAEARQPSEAHSRSQLKQRVCALIDRDDRFAKRVRALADEFESDGNTPPAPEEREEGDRPSQIVEAEARALVEVAASEAARSCTLEFVGDPEEDVEALLAADEARLAREAAEPLPEGSKWYRDGGAELEPHMAHTTMLRASWLLKLAKREVMPEREGVIPPWQLVPPEATVGLAELRRTTMAFQLPVAITSYGWAAQRHPDPTGEQLQRLVPALEAMVHSCTHGIDELSPDQRAAEWGIVWDCTPRRRARTTAPAPADPEPPTSTPARARSIPPPAARC